MLSSSLLRPSGVDAPGERESPGLAALWEVGGLWLFWLLAGMLWLAALLSVVEREQSSSLQEQRIAITLLDVQETLEGDLALGLDLVGHQQAQALIDAALAQNKELRSLDVAGADGRILFATDRGAVGEPMPEPARLAARGRPDLHRIWKVSIAGEPLLGLGLRGPFGETVGYVTTAYRLAPAQATFRGWVVVVMEIALAALAAVAVLVGVTRRALRRQDDALRNAYAAAQATRVAFEASLAHIDDSEAAE